MALPYHLLAASGQNVMLLVLLAVTVSTLAGAGYRTRLTLGLALVALYVPLAGGGPSVQRAGVMGAAGLVAALAGRPASRWYSVGLAAGVTLALDPRLAGEPGWQLSFAAVVALLLLAPPLRTALAAHGCPEPLADAAAITVAATAGTAPLMALHFGAVSPASLPANLLVAPAVAPVMWLGMLAAAVGQVSVHAAVPLSALAGYPAAYVEWVAHTAAAFPSASVGVRVSSVAGVAFAYAGLGAMAMGARRAARHAGHRAGSGARRARLPAAIGAVALAVVLSRGGPPTRGPDELVVSFHNATLARVERALRCLIGCMPSLMVDFIMSLDGYGGTDGWPGYWGMEDPEYLA